METIKVKFDQLYKGFNTSDNFFTRLLSVKYKVEISDDPEFYFFTHPVYGSKNYLKYKCHRIFWSGENIRADWNICDYVLDSDFYENNARQKRMPLWVYWDLKRINLRKSFDNINDKKKFCCMVVSNPSCQVRNDFFHRLSKYKKVDSGGTFLNNIGFPVENKMEFIKDYKFVVAFENSSYPGYTTEKLVEPLLVNSIPIYWGNPEIGKDFNTNSFINIKDVSQFDAAINKIIELDKDDEKYLAMRNESCFVDYKIPEEFSDESILQFFDYLIEDSKIKRPVATIKIKKFKHNLSEIKNRILNKFNSPEFEVKKMIELFNAIYDKAKRKFNRKNPQLSIPQISLKRNDILEIAGKFTDAKIFIETGTFFGDTIELFKNNFTNLYSIELSEELAVKAKKRFQNNTNISIVQGNSSVQLSNILKEINATCIFWLDGHYSSEFWVGKEFIQTAKGDKNTPIMEELFQIINHKVKDHIILIDDARCFNGEQGYPRIKKIENLISKYLPSHIFEVKNDIIRILPKNNLSEQC